MNNIACKINRLLSFMMLVATFSLVLVVGNAKAEEIDFSEYSSTYGYDSLLSFSNGEERQEVYDKIYAAYEAFWNSDEDLDDEYVSGSGFYYLASIDLTGYSLDSNELLEIYIAFQFDNPMFYYIATTFYGGNQSIILVVDEDYINASERARLNSLIIEKVDEYKSAADGKTTDYDKMVAVHDKLLI